jgi:hypothetical protein
LRENLYPALGRFGPARGGHRGRRYGPEVAGPIEWGTSDPHPAWERGLIGRAHTKSIL